MNRSKGSDPNLMLVIVAGALCLVAWRVLSNISLSGLVSVLASLLPVAASGVALTSALVIQRFISTRRARLPAGAGGGPVAQGRSVARPIPTTSAIWTTQSRTHRLRDRRTAAPDRLAGCLPQLDWEAFGIVDANETPVLGVPLGSLLDRDSCCLESLQ